MIGATKCGALNVININNIVFWDGEREGESERYENDKTTFKTKSLLLTVYHIYVIAVYKASRILQQYRIKMSTRTRHYEFY